MGNGAARAASVKSKNLIGKRPEFISMSALSSLALLIFPGLLTNCRMQI
jgi:hypothetical protein